MRPAPLPPPCCDQAARCAAAPPPDHRCSITMRLYTAPDHAFVGAVATAVAISIATAGGIVTAIDVTESSHQRLVVDVTCSASDATHAQELEDSRRRHRGRGGAPHQRPDLLLHS